ncbi:MAG: hypothetical protein D6758_11555 [Gammaproteobacteria bacterium]|nr:MAG: hypothetical protein D6758_11555 [Gammaproteobacteria bacterium]
MSSTALESQQAKTIDEMKGFIRKVLADPTIPAVCMEIARKYQNDPDGRRKMAEEISASTTIRIPENWSDADKIFLDAIHEVLEDEQALY